MSNKIGSIVLYPQKYDIPNNAVDGVDTENRPWRVTLKVPGLIKKQVLSGPGKAPSLEVLADTGRRAKNPCIAHPDNSPQTPHGVLLCERCEINPELAGHIASGWLSPLRADNTEPLPMYGVGYMEMRAWRQPDAPVGIGRGGRAHENYRFSAVFLQPEKARIMTAEDFVEDGAIVRYLHNATVDGQYPTIIVRAMHQGRFIRPATQEIARRYLGPEKRLMDAQEALQKAFAEKGGQLRRALANPDVTLHALPGLRLNAGPMTNARYTKDMQNHQPSKIEKIWLDPEWQQHPLAGAARHWPFRATALAARRAQSKDGQNLLLSTLHAMGPSMGDPLTLGMPADISRPRPKAANLGY